MTGRVLALHRYPVKSMLGEQISHAEVTKRGITGDRAFAVLDEATGKVASAKNPRLWRDLLTMSGTMHIDDGRLSRVLSREVRLISQPPKGAAMERAKPQEVLDLGIDARVPIDVTAMAPGTFFDFAPIHLLTTATLDRLGRTDYVRYRPNIVISTESAEESWVGRTVHIGQDLILRIVVPTPRCAVPTLAHGMHGADTDALRVPARINRLQIRNLGELPCVGVYAEVVTPGHIASGDSVRLSTP